jgi:hypothetical protein
VPISWMRAEKCERKAICRPLATGGPPPPFIGQGGGLQSCRTALSTTYDGMAHSAIKLMVVLANLASGGRRGESCACLGATSRVAAWELLVWSPSVRRLGGWADGGPEAAQRQAWRCPVVLGSHSAGHDAAAPGMAAQW